MSEPQFNAFLLALALICSLIAVVNLAQIKKRGPRVWAMACAALAFGTGALGYRQHWPLPVLIAFGVIVFFGLCLDFVLGVLGKAK